MRADRLLSILLLLQMRRRITASELARRLEVSVRTIHRDMVALGMAGVPVTAERGAGGGWRLLGEYRTNLTGLNEAEIQALFLTRPPRLLADLGLDRASEAALIKLLAALPSGAQRGAEEMRQRIHVDAAGWRQTEEPVPCLPVLQEAVWQERRVRFTYPRGDEYGERVADPLGLVAKGGAWYLVAGIEGALRSYRVSRIRDACLLDGPSVRPEGFDLAAYWRSSMARFTETLPRYPVRVRAEAGVLGRLRGDIRYARVEREEPPDADGWIPVDMLFEEEHNAVEAILSFGGQIEALAPEHLREAVLCAAKEIVARYAGGVSPSDGGGRSAG